MTEHREFMASLIDLIEYAERHDLAHAARLLSDAAEEIAPTLKERRLTVPPTWPENVIWFRHRS